MPERQRMTTRLKTLFQRPALFVLAGGINPIGAKCRRKIEMSPGVQSRDDIPRLAEEREFACIPQWS
jgi:hypothetical protein